MSGQAIIAATPQQVEAMRANASAFYSYAQQVTRAVTARWAFWNTITRIANSYGYTPEQLLQMGAAAGAFSPETAARIANDNAAADNTAKSWARAIGALDAGQAELAAWSDDKQLNLGVVVKGTLPRPLEMWPILPIIVGAAAIAAGVGAWLLIDAWLDARTIEAGTARVHAETQKAITDAVAAMGAKMGPQAAALLADALAKANAAAQQPPSGIMDQLRQMAGGAIQTVTEHTGAVASGGLLILLGLYLASKYL